MRLGFNKLGKAKHFVLIALVLLVIGIIFFFAQTPKVQSSGTMTCTTRLNSCQANEFLVFRMSNFSDAHLEERSLNNYKYVVCCADIKINYEIPFNSVGNVILRAAKDLNFPGVTNAHVEMPNQTNPVYDTNINLSSIHGVVTCSYETVSATDPKFDTCIAGISSSDDQSASATDQTNNHLSNCTAINPQDAYRRKIMCNFSYYDGEDCSFNYNCLSLKCDSGSDGGYSPDDDKCFSCIGTNGSNVGGMIDSNDLNCEAGCSAPQDCDDYPPGFCLGDGQGTICGLDSSECQKVDRDMDRALCERDNATANCNPFIWDVDGGDINEAWKDYGGNPLINEKCCGDDANELIRTRECDVGACTADPLDDSCCASPTDCVFDHQCYTAGSPHNINMDPDDEVCSSSGQWIDQCTSSLVDSNENFGIDAIPPDACGCSAPDSGKLCSIYDFTGFGTGFIPWSGYCAWDIPTNNWQCDSLTPWSKYDVVPPSPAEEVTTECKSREECLATTSFTSSYLQNGTCLSDLGDCDVIDEIVFDPVDNLLEGNCSESYSNQGGAPCDSSASSGGAFDVNGFCRSDDDISNNSCLPLASPIVMDCDGETDITYNDANTCDLGTDKVIGYCSATKAGNSCDDSLTTTTPWAQVGTCLTDGTCDQTVESVFNFSTSTFVSQCVSATLGSMCDTTAAIGGDFTHNGYCWSSGTCNVGSSSMNCNFDGLPACALGMDSPVGVISAITGYACDSNSSDGTAWNQNGTEAESLAGPTVCDTFGEVALSSKPGKAYVESCDPILVNDADQCDSSAANGGNFIRDGYCVLNLVPSTCEVGITSKDCDSGTSTIFNDTNTCASEPLISGCDATSGNACNNNPSLNPTWNQLGTCIGLGAGVTACDISDDVAYNGTNFVADCSFAYSGAMCDSTANLGGDFTHNGYCLNNNNCDITSLVAVDCSQNSNPACQIGPALDPAYRDCLANPGFACDISLTDNNEWTQNGTCLTNGQCDMANESARQGVNVVDSCATAGDGAPCDSSAATGGNFLADSICVGGMCCPSELIDVNNNKVKDFGDACGCNLGYQGMKCVNNTSQLFAGLCAYSNLTADWICDETNPWAHYASMGFLPDIVSVDCIGGADCQQTYNNNPYAQQGTCTSGTPSLCYTGDSEMVYNFTEYFTNCLNVTGNHGGDICDANVKTGGNFSPNGLCVAGDTNSNNSCITTVPIAMDCNNLNPNFNVVNTCNLGTDNVYGNCSNGDACDNTLNQWLNWSQDGTCVDSPSGPSCDIFDHVAYDGTKFVDDCNKTVGGRMCDSTANSGGDFTHNGYCLSDNNCDIYSATDNATAMNCSSDGIPACQIGIDPTYALCSSQPGAACDNFLDDGSEWVQNGTCLNDNSCDDVGMVVKNAYDHLFYSDCNLGNVWQGSMCDLNAPTGGNFLHEGYCVDGGSCTTGITSMDCDANNNTGLIDPNICTLGTDTISSSCLVTTGDSCDLNSTDNNYWSQDGICAFDSGSPICANNDIVYDNIDARFESGCQNSYGGQGGAICDNNPINGDFIQTGYCTANTDGNLCDSIGESVMFCINNVQACELGIDPVYQNCSAYPGYSCDSNITDGAFWSQTGTCLTIGTCETIGPVVNLGGGTFISGCIGHNGEVCDPSVLGGDFDGVGTCFSPNASFGACDITPPDDTNAKINVTNLNSYDWGHHVLILNCTDFVDLESGVNDGSYEYQYTLVDDGSSGWKNILGCEGVFNPCNWNTDNEPILADDNVSVRCLVKNNAELVSNYVSDSFAGIDNINPDVNITSPPDGLSWTDFVNINFSWIASDNKNVTNCSLYLNSTYQWSVGFPLNNTLLQYKIPIPFGEYNWYVTCFDIADNTNTTSTLILRQNVFEGITIEDLGFSGINPRNPEYTTSRAVVLSLAYHNTSSLCRYRNLGENWTSFETCQNFRYWFLTELNGLKSVEYEIYHNVSMDDNTTTSFTDTINLQESGYGIDITLPRAPVVIDDGEYTNDDTKLHASWSGAYDPENERLKQPFKYSVRIHDEDNASIEIDGSTDWYNVGESNEFTATGLSLENNNQYTFEVRVQNFATPQYAYNISSSDGIIVDTSIPVFVSIDTSPSNNTWVGDEVDVNARAQDTPGVRGFSYVLSSIPEIKPDSTVEVSGTVVDFKLSEFDDGDNWLVVSPVDLGGNVGLQRAFVFRYDPTPPNKPFVVSPFIESTENKQLTCEWQQDDDISGIDRYFVEIRDLQDNLIVYDEWTVGNEKMISITVPKKDSQYFCRVKSRNGAELQSLFSDEELPLVKPLKISSISSKGYTNKEYFNLKAYTSENAKCYYTIDSKETIFEETGKKLHITPLNIYNGVKKDVVVRCIQKIGQSATNTTSITVDTSLVPNEFEMTFDREYFVSSIGNFRFSVSSNGKGIDGFEREDLKVYLNSSQIDYYSLDSLSNGEYSLSISLPDTAGNQKLGIGILGFYNEFDVELNEMELTIAYLGGKSQETGQKMIVAQTGSYQFGVASEGKDAVVENTDQGFAIKASPKDSSSYIFMTNNQINPLVRENYLKNRKFETLTNPSFGYLLAESYVVDSVLGYNNIRLTGDLNLPTGRYNLLIKNMGIDKDGYVVLEIKVVNPQG